MENAQKFVWAYIIEQGEITDGTWCYYGGRWNPEDFNASHEKRVKQKKELLKKVKTIGVNWDLMEHPVSSNESIFQGTDSSSTNTGTLLGTLVLKDGSIYLLGVSGYGERIGSYMKFLQEACKEDEDKKRVKDILGEDLT